MKNTIKTSTATSYQEIKDKAIRQEDFINSLEDLEMLNQFNPLEEIKKDGFLSINYQF